MLLDTHIFLWWLFDDAQLSVKNRELIQDINTPIYVSAASVWEITTKFRLGKLPKATAVAKDVPLWIKRAGFQPLAINAQHAQLAGSWDIAHRDPFDRMLAAQAKKEKMPLMTNDKVLADFPIRIIK